MEHKYPGAAPLTALRAFEAAVSLGTGHDRPEPLWPEICAAILDTRGV